jgi:O-antigen ligase
MEDRNMSLKTLIKHIENKWYILVMLLLIGGFVALWMEMTGRLNQVDEGNEFIRTLLIIAYGISLLSLVFYFSDLIKVILNTPWLWLLICWAVLSFLWSNQPELTLRRSFSLLFATLLGVTLYIKYTFTDFLKLISFVLMIIILGSILIVFIKPEWGIMEGNHEGAWRGIMTHKNLLGIASLAAITTLLYFWKAARGLKRLIFWGFLFSSFLVLFFSRSLTSYLIACILLGSYVTIRLARKFRKQWPIYAIFIIGVFIVFIFIIIVNYSSLLSFFGRDVTLTGRIPLWKAVIPYIQERPLLGYGYRSFWLMTFGPSLNVWEIVGWKAPHAHNGYIDLWLQLGIVGLILCLIFIFDFFIKTIRNIIMLNDENETFNFQYIALIALYIFLYNLSESIILQSTANHAFYWVLLVYLYIYVKMTPKLSN